MPISTSCPNCQALFRLSDDTVGKKVRCQRCVTVFIVPASDGATTTPGIGVPSEAPPPAAPAPVDAANPAPPPPMESAPPPAQPGDADRITSEPPAPRKSRDPDEPEPRPRRREKPTKSNSGMIALTIVLVGGGLLTCLVCSGAVGFWVVRDHQVKPPAMAKERMIKKVDKGRIVNDFKGKDFDVKPDFGFKDIGKIDEFPVIDRKDGGLIFKDGGPNPDFAFKPFIKNMPAQDLDFFLKARQPILVRREMPPGKKGLKLTLMNLAPAGGIPVAFDASGRFRTDHALAANEPRNQFNKLNKQYAVQFTAGQRYQIDMLSGFDAYLYLINDANVVVAQDDDGGVGLNSRITFDATRTAPYRIQATSLGGITTGDYTLVVQQRQQPK